MSGLWLSLGIIFGSGGLVFRNGPEVIAGAFCLLMALVSALIRDHRINDHASDDLNHLDALRVGYERKDRAA